MFPNYKAVNNMQALKTFDDIQAVSGELTDLQ